MEFEFEFTKPEAQPEYRSTGAGPMRILLMGDFSGRGNRGLLEHGDRLADRPISAVDVDNLDELVFRYAPRLHLPLGDPAGPAMTVEFKRLDDFHPDELYDRLELFQALRDTRRRLVDPKTSARASAELRHEAGQRPTGAEPEDGPAEDHHGEILNEDEGSMFARLLGKKPAEPPRVRSTTSASSVDISGLIREVIGPYIVPGADPRHEQLVSSVDVATGDRMRSLLHDRSFQALEAAWRGVHWLVNGLETGEELALHLLDVSKEELAADIVAAGRDLSRSGLYRLLVDRGRQTAGGEPFSLLIGEYSFGGGSEDLTLLSALGATARGAGAPFLAAAETELVGCSSLEDTPDPSDWATVDAETGEKWHALRNSSVAPWLGLALPRLMLRLPYGGRTDEVERFDFEELSEQDHEAFLWGNPALSCAMLIGRAFLERGWEMQPGDLLELDDLPAYTYEDGGESKLKPCAEVLLSRRAGERISSRGLMPLLSHKNRNAVRLMRFQSLAAPPTELSGPWA